MIGVLPQYAEAIVATIERVNANAVGYNESFRLTRLLTNYAPCGAVRGS